MSDFSAKIRAILDTSKIPSQIKGIENKTSITLRKFTLDTKGLPSQIQASLDGHKFKISLDGIKTTNIDSEMQRVGGKAGQAFSQSLVNRINAQLSNGGISSSISKVTAQFQKLFNSATNNDMHFHLNQINTDLERLKELQNGMLKAKDSTELVTSYQQFNEVLSRVINNLSTVSSQSKTFVSNLQVKTLDNKIEIWMEKNSRATKNFGERLSELRRQLSELSQNGGVNTIQFKSIEQEFNSIKQAATAAGETGKSFTDTFEEGFRSISNYVSISTVIYQFINALRQMYQNVYNIDKEMTELKKVTNETSEAYNKFLKSSATTAKQIGTTISDFISSTADFARLGYSFADSQELAKVANIYSVVGDEIDSIDTATKSLISTMTAFYSEIDSSMSQGEFALSIVDKFNEVSNNFAISSGGIGDALERSASSLSAANNSLDQTIALITAANTIVQDADAVGNAFKTISMRVRGAKTELEEAGLETEGMATSTAKLRAEIQALSGVDIMLDENTFKSTYDIMDELAAKWKDLTDIQQASITELLAGKHQGNVVSSLMENFDIAREALQTSLGSEGSAMAEHEKWMESLEAKINQLKAAWEALSQSFMDDKFLKGIVDTGTSLLDAFTKVTDTIGTLPTIVMIAMAAMTFKNVGRNKMFFLIHSSKMPTVIEFYIDIYSLYITLNEIH